MAWWWFLSLSSFFPLIWLKNEIKENEHGTNSDRKETRTQVNGLEQKEEINIQTEKNEETRIQNNEERLRNLQDILKNVPTSEL